MRYDSGYLVVPYCWETCAPRSRTTVYGGAAPAKYLSMTSQSSSTLTATSSNFERSTVEASLRSDGSSSRQGGHQVAQKLSSTTLPLYCERSRVLPSWSGSLNEGASAGGSSSASRAPAARASLPPECCTNLPTATTEIDTTAKATKASFTRRGTTQLLRPSTGIPE